MIIRGFAALVISAVLGIGTLVVVNNASNDANETAKEITRQSLEYQKEAMKDADAQSTQVQEDVNDQIEAAQKQIEDATN
jgi:gas vesicle protein